VREELNLPRDQNERAPTRGFVPFLGRLTGLVGQDLRVYEPFITYAYVAADGIGAGAGPCRKTNTIRVEVDYGGRVVVVGTRASAGSSHAACTGVPAANTANSAKSAAATRPTTLRAIKCAPTPWDSPVHRSVAPGDGS